MKKTITNSFLSSLFVLMAIALMNVDVVAQCTSTTSWGSATAPVVENVPTTITTCALTGEYSTVTNAQSGSTYEFTGSGSGGNAYLTVRQGTPTGAALGHGFSPVTVTATATGSLYLHYHSSAACGTASLGCLTGTVTLLPTAACSYDVPSDIVVNNTPGQCGATVTFNVGPGDCLENPEVEPPSGTFFNVGTTTVVVGSGTAAAEEFTVTVNDVEAPTVNCPSNINVTLNPGECNRIVNYSVTADDNCPFISDPMTLETLQASNNGGSSGGQVLFDLNNLTGGDINITELGMKMGSASIVNVYITPNTYVGQENNMGAWDFIGTADATGGPFFPAGLTPAPTDLIIPAGSWGVALITPTSTQRYTNGTGANQFYTDGNIELNLGAAKNVPWAGGTFSPRVWNGYITYTMGGGGEIVQTDGLPSGSTFEVGTVTNCFETEDNAGNIGVCCFDVTVSEFPNPTLALVCNNLVNISVDPNCEALINADMILEGGPYKCYDDYIITIETLSGLPVGNPISGLYAGQNLVVSVEDPDTGNSCWGYVFVEDKLPPSIVCRDVVIDCNDELPTQPAPGIDAPISLLIENLEDPFGGPLANPRQLEYEFDFGFLPLDATVLDVDVRVKMEHSWASQLTIEVEDPNGNVVTIFNVTGGTGCINTANPFDIDVTFDDEGDNAASCNDLDRDGDPIRPLMAFFVSFNTLEDFDGENASGTWLVRFIHTSTLGAGEVEKVGLTLEVDAPTIDPEDNCGLASLQYVDVVEPGDCDDEFASVVTRTWTATDLSGNQASCDQIISIERGDLEDYTAPATWMADCGDNFATDVNGHPHPSASGSPIAEACDNVVGSYTDVRINDQCGGYKIIRTWTLLDWCTLETVKLTQLLKISNDEAPEFEKCPDPGTVVTVSTRFNDCVGDYIAQNLIAFNNCTGEPITNIVVTATAGTVVWNQQIQRYQVLNLPVGQHTITYIANDGCGNIAECSYILNVVDNVPPIAICDERTRVSLGSNGEALVHVSAWDDGSYDNCGVASILAYRKGIRHLFPAATTPCHAGNQNPDRNSPRPQIKFCCADISQPGQNGIRGQVDIVVEVTDFSGNMNICWVTVEVEDKLPPVVQCPPNVVIDCKYEFDFPLGQLTDAELNATFDAEFGGPIAVDNCQLEFEDWIIQFDLYNSQCGIGAPVPPVVNPPMAPYTAYRRVFIAEDAGGNQANCIQDIVILPNFDNPFIGDDLPWPQGDIRWPQDETVGSCLSADDDALSPEALGSEPFLRAKGCAKPVAGYQDQIFTFVDDACFKILRTWTVIDWCNHNPNTGQGEWTHVQVINVMDDGAATCNNCEDKVFVDDSSSDCNGFAELVLDVSDCTPQDMLQVSWKIDAFQTGVFEINGTGLDASGNYPFGEHTIRWTVYDLCSNLAVFEYDFEVVDGKKPSPVCLNGIATVVMPVSGDITIPAAFFDVASFDNCTASEDLIFSYSSDVAHLTETWSCEDLDGSNEQTFEVEVWVTDEAGNQDFCVTYILIQDNNNICPDTAGGTAAISGFIFNELAEEVENVMMTLSGVNNNFLSNQLANESGYFDMLVYAGQNYAIQGQRTDNPLNGVTTFDIALIQRHILGTQFLNSPYKLIAADVNNDGHINVLDIAQLRRVILGTYSEFPNNDSWKIIVDEPLEMGVRPPAHNMVLDLGHVVRDMEDNNFIAVKIGDVNASHQANGMINSDERTLSESLRLLVEDKVLKAGEQVVVEVRSDNIDGIFGYQGTIDFDARSLEFVAFESGVIGLDDANFGFHMLSEGMITTSWNELEGVASGEGVLFSLIFEVRQDGSLSNMLNFGSARTVAESYNDRGVMGVEMVFENRLTANDFALYQNTPNPFNGETLIGFNLPEAAKATLTVYDVTGKVVRVLSGDYAAGYSEVRMVRSDFGSAGVYYYQLETENFSATKKMIFMD